MSSTLCCPVKTLRSSHSGHCTLVIITLGLSALRPYVLSGFSARFYDLNYDKHAELAARLSVFKGLHSWFLSGLAVIFHTKLSCESNMSWGSNKDVLIYITRFFMIKKIKSLVVGRIIKYLMFCFILQRLQCRFQCRAHIEILR